MMKRFLPAVIVLCSVLFFMASCAGETDPAEPEAAKAEYTKISPEQAKEMMEEEVIILDVRTEEEFAEVRIEGALLIPDYAIGELAEEKLPDKQATILVYCRTGRRSEDASRELLEMGYESVYDFGGIMDWPYDTVSNR